MEWHNYSVMEENIYVDVYQHDSNAIRTIPIEIRECHYENVPLGISGEDALLVLEALMREKVILGLQKSMQNENDFYNR